MTRAEFESMVGRSVESADYELIQYVYIGTEINKAMLVDFYKHFNMNGIESLYHALNARDAKINELQSKVALLETALTEQHCLNLQLKNEIDKICHIVDTLVN